MASPSKSESATYILILSAVDVKREDIARAKQWVLTSDGRNVPTIANIWLDEQNARQPSSIDGDSPKYEEMLREVAGSLSLRLAFYHALWELIYSGELFPGGATTAWNAGSIEYKTKREGSGIDLSKLTCSHPDKIERPLLSPVVSTDVDIFLKGIDCTTLNSGIHEVIEQSLTCFARGLYLSATVMLAAAVEAAWTETGLAVAKKLSDKKLGATINDEQFGIARKVTDIRKSLESNPASRTILSDAGRTKHDVANAEVWTTVLRERRNALHWGKARSFIADHSETASLLMAAQLHLATLEAIRLAC